MYACVPYYICVLWVLIARTNRYTWYYDLDGVTPNLQTILTRQKKSELKNIVTKRALSRQIKKYCTMIEEIKSWRQNKPIVYN